MLSRSSRRLFTARDRVSSASSLSPISSQPLRNPFPIAALSPLANAFRVPAVRALSSTAATRSDNISMADACREMEAHGVPKKGEPTAAAAPAQEQQKELPKLSAAEFRVYNRMAEHMDMFVRFCGFPFAPRARSAFTWWKEEQMHTHTHTHPW